MCVVCWIIYFFISLRPPGCHWAMLKMIYFVQAKPRIVTFTHGKFKRKRTILGSKAFKAFEEEVVTLSLL